MNDKTTPRNPFMGYPVKQLPPGNPTPDSDDVPPPDPNGDYMAYRGFLGRGLPAVLVYFNAAERKSHGKKKRQLQFVQLEADDEMSGFNDDGQSFSVVFSNDGGRHRLTVRGRNLEKIYDLLSHHKLAWIRSIDADRDFKGRLPDDAEVITGIDIEVEAT